MLPICEKGYVVSLCPGSARCPNAVTSSAGFKESLEKFFEESGVTEFLKEREGGFLLHHNRFSVAISECPNGCSQPHIKDVGIIGEAVISYREELCDGCFSCVSVCQERALKENGEKVSFLRDLCLGCGACTKSCPTGSLQVERKGYRVLLGGKLGRHPRLATELARCVDEKTAFKIVKAALDIFMREARKGERLGDVIERLGWRAFVEMLNLST